MTTLSLRRLLPLLLALGCAPGEDGDEWLSQSRSAELPATISISGTARDFKFSHPDFEDYIGDDRGMVTTTIGADSKPVYAHADTVSTTGAANFNQWFNDTAGVNASTSYPITLELVSTSPPLYRYTNSSFFPLDGQLYGNEGKSHNYAFTYELHTVFQYTGGEKFSFTGDDDVFVYINKKLVIDLGGVHPQQSASVNLDNVASSLGLVIGGVYQFDMFFAERHTTQSNFKVETSIASFADCQPGYSAGIIGLDGVDVSGTPSITGAFPSVFSNISVELAGNYDLEGDAVSGGTVEISGNKLPGGQVIEDASQIVVPDPSGAVAAAAVTNDNAKIPTVTVGKKKKSPLDGTALELSSQQVIYLTTVSYSFTSVDVSGQARIDLNGIVTIYLAGGASFNGGSATNSQQDSLTIVSSSSDELKFNGGGTTTTHVFAPNAAVRFSGTQDFKGSVVGREVRISGTAELEVPTDVLSAQTGVCDEDDFDDAGDEVGDEVGDEAGDEEDTGLPPLPPIPN